MSQSYQQPERYYLMQYQCEKCLHLELIWNSRNAVTPFCIACDLPGCGGMKQHVNWQADQRRSSLPAQASRVFVSATPADAQALAEQKWETFMSREDLPNPPEPKQETLANWANYILGDGNQPYAISRAEYLRRQSEEGQPS